MINKPPPFNDLNIRIPIKGRGFINHGSGLGLKQCLVSTWGFPNLGVPSLGVPIIRIIVYWGLYWGPVP